MSFVDVFPSSKTLALCSSDSNLLSLKLTCLPKVQGFQLFISTSNYSHFTYTPGEYMTDLDSLVKTKIFTGSSYCSTGMNPLKIGDPEVDKPNADKEEETVLIHQEFLLDEDKTVHEFLEEEGLDVVDFVRFECGASEEQKQAQDLKAAQAGA